MWLGVVVVRTSWGWGGGGWNRQWWVVNDMVTYPLPLPSSSTLGVVMLAAAVIDAEGSGWDRHDAYRWGCHGRRRLRR